MEYDGYDDDPDIDALLDAEADDHDDDPDGDALHDAWDAEREAAEAEAEKDMTDEDTQ